MEMRWLNLPPGSVSMGVNWPGVVSCDLGWFEGTPGGSGIPTGSAGRHFEKTSRASKSLQAELVELPNTSRNHHTAYMGSMIARI